MCTNPITVRTRAHTQNSTGRMHTWSTTVTLSYTYYTSRRRRYRRRTNYFLVHENYAIWFLRRRGPWRSRRPRRRWRQRINALAASPIRLLYHRLAAAWWWHFLFGPIFLATALAREPTETTWVSENSTTKRFRWWMRAFEIYLMRDSLGDRKNVCGASVCGVCVWRSNNNLFCASAISVARATTLFHLLCNAVYSIKSDKKSDDHSFLSCRLLHCHHLFPFVRCKQIERRRWCSKKKKKNFSNWKTK